MKLILQIVLGIALIPTVVGIGILNDLIAEQKKKNFFDVERMLYIKRLEFWNTILIVFCLVLLLIILNL